MNRTEILEDLRFYQQSGLIHGDELPVPGMGMDDFDRIAFGEFFEKHFGERLEEQEVPLEELLQNMNLMKAGTFNIAAALLFGKHLDFKLPICIIKAVCFPGDTFHETQYIDSRDISGKLTDQFQQSKGFVLANIHHIQGEQGVNSIGVPEIPTIALEELITNALIHRDYFVSAPIRIFVFDNRVEIISPGHLPNNLSIENIKRGNSNIRNPILASYATKLLPYRGLGSGIVRALRAHPHIDFEDDREGNLFKVTLWRKQHPRRQT